MKAKPKPYTFLELIFHKLYGKCTFIGLYNTELAYVVLRPGTAREEISVVSVENL